MKTLGIGVACLLAVVLMGTTYNPGRGTSEDMVALEMANVVPGVHHVGLTAPDPGRIVHLQWTTRVSGSGVGDALFDVVRESDDTVLCTATVPCAQAIAGHVHVECDAEIIAAEHLDVAPRAPGCALMPQGVLVATFVWQ